MGVLVSVVIITFNQERFIEECIESVLSQSFDDYEIIISDDHSTDATLDILKSYERKYPNKITILHSEYNQGITKNTKKALSFCKGDFICLMGGDDLFYQDKIEKQVLFLLHREDILYCFHNCDIIYSDGVDKKRNKTYSHLKQEKIIEFEDLLYKGVDIVPSTIMFRKSVLEYINFDERIFYSSDTFFYYELSIIGKGIFLPEILSAYRRSNSNITNKVNKEIKQKFLEDSYIILALLQARYSNYEIIIDRGIINRKINQYLEYKNKIKILYLLFKPFTIVVDLIIVFYYQVMKRIVNRVK